MATIFPTSPAPEINDEYQGYRYDGTSWNIIGVDLTGDYQPRVASVSSTELGYLDGVTSAIQTQLNAKQSTISVGSGLTLSSSTVSVNPGAMLNQIVGGTSGNSYGLVGTSTYLDVKDTNGYNKEIELDITAVKTQLTTDGFLVLQDSGWINVSSLANNFTAPTTVAYRKLNGVVYMRGNLYNGTANTGAFTLPSGYRPSVDVVVPAQKYGTSNIDYVTVGTDGVVVPNSTAAWLSGVCFPVG